MILKVCGMREPHNIREVLALPVDILGLIFYSASPRAIDPSNDDLARFIKQLNVQTAGVFVDEDIHTVWAIARRFRLDIVQLHGQESPHYCAELKQGYRVIKSVSVGSDIEVSYLESYLGSVDWFLFDTRSGAPGGSGKKFNWDLLTQYTLDVPFFLSGGIGPEDGRLIAGIPFAQFMGIDVNSRFEISPGFKDAHLLRTLIEDIK
jgi:phosphoribosylanthranilate isomerase